MQVDLHTVTLEAQQAWSASPLLRAEFGDDQAAFLAYRRAEARGAPRIFSGSVVRGVRPAQSSALHLTLDAPVMLSSGAAISVTLSGPARGHVRGYGAVFGGMNRQGFRIKPGAFRASLSRVPIPMLWRHDSGRVVGSWTALQEDHIGLMAHGQINLNVAAGREAFALLEARDVTGLSVGFNVEPADIKEVDGVREVAALDLLEISLAPVPAEDRARITNVGA